MPRLNRAPLAASKLLATLVRQGPWFSYHWYQERRALRHQRRADIEPHLAARLNLRGTSSRSALKGILEISRCRDIRDLNYEVVQQRRDELSAQFHYLPLDDTFDLYTYFRYFGDFRVANFLRIQMLQAYMRLQQEAARVIPGALAAAIEQGMPDFVLDAVSRKEVQVKNRIAINKAIAMAHALRGEIAKAIQLWTPAFQPWDHLFGEAIRGKTIAVVGPAPHIEDFCAERDSFDLFVRTNYDGNTKSKCESRTDISYYNWSRLASHGREIVAVAPSLQWLVASRRGDQFLRRMLPTHHGIRCADDALPLFLHANPLAIPIILSDLIRFQPARIKVFCTNFFASSISYNSEYHRRAKGTDAISHSLRVHDPFSSYSLVQHLHAAELCAVDTVASEVLKLGRDHYADQLQQLYGAHTIANQNPHLKDKG